MARTISLAEFKSLAKDAGQDTSAVGEVRVIAPGGKLLTQTKEQAEQRIIPWVISTARVDRERDTIAVDGWDLTAFTRKRGPVLWAHVSSPKYSGGGEWSGSGLPLANGLNTRIDGDKLLSDAGFPEVGLYPFADLVYAMATHKPYPLLSASSVGFLPKRWAYAEDTDRGWGVDFLEQELLEWSIVPVEANPDALQGAGKSLDLRLLRDWTEQALDGGHLPPLVERGALEAQWNVLRAECPAPARKSNPLVRGALVPLLRAAVDARGVGAVDAIVKSAAGSLTAVRVADILAGKGGCPERAALDPFAIALGLDDGLVEAALERDGCPVSREPGCGCDGTKSPARDPSPAPQGSEPIDASTLYRWASEVQRFVDEATPEQLAAAEKAMARLRAAIAESDPDAEPVLFVEDGDETRTTEPVFELDDDDIDALKKEVHDAVVRPKTGELYPPARRT